MKRIFLSLLCIYLTLLSFALAESEEILTLPVDLTAIEAEAFMGDSALKHVNLPPKIQTIGARAFAGSSIESIFLPADLASIGENAFADCPNLTATVVKNSVGLTYCKTNNIPYKVVSEESAHFSKVSTLIQGDIFNASSSYMNSNGAVTRSEVSAVLKSVGDCVEKYFEQGLISEYSIGTSYIHYRIDGCALDCYYVPHVEGYLSGGNEVSMSVLRYMPFNTTPKKYSSKEGKFVHLVEPLPGTALTAVSNNIVAELAIYDDYGAYKNSDVNLKSLSSFAHDQVILWIGHGYKFKNKSYTYLGTGMSFSESLFDFFFENGYIDNNTVIYSDDRFLVATDFIHDFCGDMTNSFVWLGACHSGNDDLLETFINCNAAAVLGFSDEVKKLYNDELLTAMFDRMLQINERTQEFYTASEALEYATKLCGSSDPYNEVEQRRAKPILKLRDPSKDYRLIERIRYSGTIYGKSFNTSNEPKPLSGAYLEFNCLDDVRFTQKIYASEDGSYQVDLYEGNYSVTIKEDNNIQTSDKYESTTFSLAVKRYDDQELDITLKALEGSVAGAFTDSFSKNVIEGVALSIVNKDKEVVWTGTTDEDGFYRAYLAPGSYTMTASKDGFTSASYSFQIKANTQTTMNKVLQRIMGKVYGIMTDSFTGNPAVQLWYTIVDIDGNDIYTNVVTSSSGSYSVQLPIGSYTMTFPKPYNDRLKSYFYSIIEGSYPFVIKANESTELNCTPKCVHRYELRKGFSSYNEAVTASESLGGHLATISSPEEDSILFWMGYHNAELYSSTPIFGLIKDNEDGEWHWVTGEPLIYTNWDSNRSTKPEVCWAYYDDNKFHQGDWLTGGPDVKKDYFFIFEWDNP